MPVTTPKLNTAISGLGRMGKRHAQIYLSKVHRASIVAVFAPASAVEEAAWAAINLPGVRVYSNYDEMLAHPGLEAVVIATATTVHAEQAIKAIKCVRSH